MFSGKNGKVLHRFVGAKVGDNFGFAVSDAGDVNQDGHADVVVGAPQPSYFGGPGYARVFSGLDGKILITVIGSKDGDGLGFAVSSAGDVNRDKHPDLIVSAAQIKNAGIGYVGVLSGKDGKIIFGFSGGNKNDRFGWAVSGGQDVDADGYPDILVGAPGTDTMGVDSGCVRLFSGKNGWILHTLHGDSAGDRFGCSVSAIGDVDKDGHADLIVGADEDDNRGTNSGCARVFSGKRGSTLYSFDGDAANDKFGRCVSGVGDLNRDGHPDFVVGAPEDDNIAASSGIARVFSGKRLTLWSDVHQLSLKKAGTQKLSLDAGSTQATRYYWVFGSASGTTPGVTLAGAHIPLNPDLYTDFVLATANSTALANFRGKLDAKGQATAAINVPSGLPRLVDFTLYHAYVVHDAKGVLYLASNPATLRLTN